MKQISEQIITSNPTGGREGLCAACTLFEGKYHYGVAALINSLYQNGYRGVFYAGYRGALPPWAEGKADFTIAEGLQIRFLLLETATHFTFCKALLIERLLDEVRPELEAVIYFDPDIIVKCPWRYLTDWTEDRIALCQDVNWNCPSSHPIRRDWDRYVNPLGYFPKHQQNFYYNAGFVGVARSQRKFIEIWEGIMQAMRPSVGNLNQIIFSDVNYCFHKADQDFMNIAADIMPEVICAMGPEAMDFDNGGHTLAHAAGPLKPWRSQFLRNALGGQSPSKADKAFFEYAQAPIQIFSPGMYAWRTFKLRLAAAITRFIRRG